MSKTINNVFYAYLRVSSTTEVVSSKMAQRSTRLIYIIINRDLWPPRSPDGPLDYFMFGHLKHVLHSNRLHTIKELQEAIVNVMNKVTPRKLNNIFPICNS